MAADQSEATNEGFFGWPGVVDDRNIMGPYSIAIPGLLAGLGLAHKTYGRLPWSDLAQPAIIAANFTRTHSPP